VKPFSKPPFCNSPYELKTGAHADTGGGEDTGAEYRFKRLEPPQNSLKSPVQGMSQPDCPSRDDAGAVLPHQHWPAYCGHC
jgi:hypothetical protein